MENKLKIAIVGAGIAGLAAARILAANDYDVTVFEKSRGVGGRLSTRYANDFEFDHGAQYFTAQSPVFIELVHQMQADGVVEPWHGDFVQLENNQPVTLLRDNRSRYVGVPRMNAVGKYLARGLSILLNHQITKIISLHKGLQVEINHKLISEKFDWIVCAIPDAQLKSLLPSNHQFSKSLSDVVMQGCHVLMLGLDDSFRMPNWQGASIKNSCIQWISCNSSKPRRAAKPTLVVLSANQWSEDHAQTNLEHVQTCLSAAASQMFELETEHIQHTGLHYWRYANCIKPMQPDTMLDINLRLAICGDWTQGAKVEVAYLSGQRVAQELIKYLANL